MGAKILVSTYKQTQLYENDYKLCLISYLPMVCKISNVSNCVNICLHNKNNVNVEVSSVHFLSLLRNLINMSVKCAPIMPNLSLLIKVQKG